MAPDDAEAFLRQPHVGVVASLRCHGRPYTVPVWNLWDGTNVWITGTESRIWCRQLMHDPRISLCVEAMTPVPGHVGIDGTAEILRPPEHDIWPISRQLADKYVGGAAAPGLPVEAAKAAAVDAFGSVGRRTPPSHLLGHCAVADHDDAVGDQGVDLVDR